MEECPGKALRSNNSGSVVFTDGLTNLSFLNNVLKDTGKMFVKVNYLYCNGSVLYVIDNIL